MDTLINNAITDILQKRKDFLKIVVRQKNKFEGWLKFELAHYLEKLGMESVEVESRMEYRRDRYDISFFHQENFYRVELKTPNTNWDIKGIQKKGKPITKNIQSIIDDARKLNSSQGIIAFVLFPIPVQDTRWHHYVDRISQVSEIPIDKGKQCQSVKITIDGFNSCELLVCTFKSRIFSTLS
jgi:hypothetical protein